MLNESVPVTTVPSTAPTAVPPPPTNPSLADAAAVLLPALEHASELLATAARILRDLSGHPPQKKGDAIAEAMKAKRLLAAFGPVPKRR